MLSKFGCSSQKGQSDDKVNCAGVVGGRSFFSVTGYVFLRSRRISVALCPNVDEARTAQFQRIVCELRISCIARMKR